MTEVLERPRVASPAARTRDAARPRHVRRGSSSDRRADIEGLRAVAVLGVLAFHAGLPFVPGGFVGVDVFFVISGFLITGLVAAEMELTGRLSLARFYARRIKRLLPAAVLVLVVTAIASALVLSPLARGQAGGDIVSAALYVSNWHFAIQQTDYLSVQSNPSPVLHYWSLSVEEQYYVLWPVILLLTVVAARRYRLVTRRAVQTAVILVGLVSLVWSLMWTTSNPPYAFFGLMTRAWELALGGVVALCAVNLSRLPTWARSLLGWSGLAAIVWSMVAFTEDTLFPGTAALVPVVGAAAVIVAGLPRMGRAQHQRPAGASLAEPGPGLLLGIQPMRAVGRVSYSLYLWHWPPLVLVPVALGWTLTPALGVTIVLLACVPAWLSYRYVEEPFRHSQVLVQRPRRAFGLAAALTGTAVVVALLAGNAAPAAEIKVQVAAPGGAVRTVEVDPAQARKDQPSIYHDGCEAGYSTTSPKRCVFGQKDSPRRMALMGDSHAAQWFPGLSALASREGFALEVDSKSGCSAADVTQFWRGANATYYDECPLFREALLKAWENDAKTRPDVVVVASRNLLIVTEGTTKLDLADSLKAQREGMVRTFERLEAMGISVVLISDLVSPGFDVPDCLAAHGDDYEQCAFSAAEAAPPLAADTAAADAAGVPVIDLAPTICPGGTCQPIIDGQIVFRDDHHVTATFAQNMATEIGRQLRKTPAWDLLTPA